MTRCIYEPEIELNDDRLQNDLTKTLEHIVPWALGGSDCCSIEDVSKKANNDLGTEIDAPLSNLLPIAFWRHRLKLEGHSRTIPPIVFNATATKNGAEAKITFHADGRVDFVPGLQVRKDQLAREAEQVSIAGQPVDVERVLQGMRQKAERTGRKFHTITGDPLITAADFERQYESVELDEFKLHGIQSLLPEFNQKVWARGLLKMVLGLGHKVVGPEWTFGQWGDLVRRCLSADESHWAKDQLRGRLTCRLSQEICRTLGITSESIEHHEHVLAVLPADTNKPMMAVVSLFGGENVPQAIIGIGPPVGDLLVAPDDTLPAQLPLGWRIRPSTRSVEAITVAEMVARAAP